LFFCFLDGATAANEVAAEFLEVIEEEGVFRVGDELLVESDVVVGVERSDQLRDHATELGADVGPALDPEVGEVFGDSGSHQGGGDASGEAHLTICVPGSISPSGLGEVIDLRDDGSFFEAVFGEILGVAHISVDVGQGRRLGDVGVVGWIVVQRILHFERVHGTILLSLLERATRGVDGDEMAVDTEPVSVGVVVGEDASLEHLLVGREDSGDHVRGGESDLFGFQEMVLDVFVEGHGTDQLHRDLVLGPLVSGIQNVE